MELQNESFAGRLQYGNIDSMGKQKRKSGYLFPAHHPQDEWMFSSS